MTDDVFSNCANCGYDLTFDRVNPSAITAAPSELEGAKCNNCGSYYERKPGKDFAYQDFGDGKFRRTKESGEVLTAIVRHSAVTVGGMETGGNIFTIIPYCSKHEKAPDPEGWPIAIRGRGLEFIF